jgi:putative membrane protein
MEQHEAFNWEVPQRQPLAGLGIVFIKTLLEIAKRVWPFLLLMVFRETEEEGVGKYELIAIAFASLTIIGSIVKFYFFRFFILGEELIIKKGWLKKETIVIPLQKIQTVHIEQSALHQVLNIVKLSVDTAGSSKTEVTIDALSRPMAEALQGRLQSSVTADPEGAEEHVATMPIFTLGIKDLLKLSISANHIEAFFILLSFTYGLYDSIKTISGGLVDEATGLFPRHSILLFAILCAVVLGTTILISTIRIFLKFYSFSVLRNPAGFYIKRGLTNVKEQLVPFGRIQFVTWSANWIRKQMGLWLLEYKVAGGTDIKNKLKVEVPVTDLHFIDTLVADYHTKPDLLSLDAVRIHPTYVTRRILMAGILPAALLMGITWYWWETNALLLTLIPVLVGFKAFALQSKFRAFALAEVLYIDRSSYGSKMVLLRWHKLQTVTLEQSIYQRSRDIATLKLHTASGTIVLPYIPLPAARGFMNYALYKIESSSQPWM